MTESPVSKRVRFASASGSNDNAGVASATSASRRRAGGIVTTSTTFLCFLQRSRRFRINLLHPTCGPGRVGTASGSEHTTRQNITEVKPDLPRKTRWGEGAGVARCGCGRPLAGERGVDGRSRGFAPQLGEAQLGTGKRLLPGQVPPAWRFLFCPTRWFSNAAALPPAPSPATRVRASFAHLARLHTARARRTAFLDLPAPLAGLVGRSSF